MFTIPSMAQPITLKEGLYKTTDLNLSPNTIHTIQNNSNSEYAFLMIFDSNHIAQQFMQLKPQSEKYILSPIASGYEILIVTNEEVVIN